MNTCKLFQKQKVCHVGVASNQLLYLLTYSHIDIVQTVTSQEKETHNIIFTRVYL